MVDTRGSGHGINVVDDNNAWLSASRTLGSLFLRQEDAERATGGRGNDRVEGGGAPVAQRENSFAQYMMGLKLQQEENNREMMATNMDHGVIRRKVADDASSREGGMGTLKATMGGVEIDPVSWPGSVFRKDTFLSSHGCIVLHRPTTHARRRKLPRNWTRAS